YALNPEAALKPTAQKAIDYLVDAQDPKGGGWRYHPRISGDLSVTAWVVPALVAGEKAGLRVPAASLKSADAFVASCATKEGQFSYLPGSPASPTMTAAGLHLTLLLGGDPKGKQVIDGLEYLNKKAEPGTLKSCYTEFRVACLYRQLGG